MSKDKKNSKVPILNKEKYNDYDILFDCKQTAHDLLVLYFYFMAEVSSEQNFNKIEEVAYELIEDYRGILTLITKLGWFNEVYANDKDVISLIQELKNKRKDIEDENNVH